jgi:hypothetical protein
MVQSPRFFFADLTARFSLIWALSRYVGERSRAKIAKVILALSFAFAKLMP